MLVLKESHSAHRCTLLKLWTLRGEENGCCDKLQLVMCLKGHFSYTNGWWIGLRVLNDYWNLPPMNGVFLLGHEGWNTCDWTRARKTLESMHFLPLETITAKFSKSKMSFLLSSQGYFTCQLPILAPLEVYWHSKATHRWLHDNCCRTVGRNVWTTERS